MTMAFAVGGVSGGHFNPAVSLGPALAGRFDAKNLVRYWAVQVAGAIIAAAVLYVIASGKAGFVAGGFASNGFGDLSPGGYGLVAALLTKSSRRRVFFVAPCGGSLSVQEERVFAKTPMMARSFGQMSAAVIRVFSL